METILAIIVALGLYSQTFVVTDVTETETGYIVICEDFTENIWEFTAEDGDWDKGDLVSAIMTDNGTPDYIYDDEFITVRYSGYIQ